ncbi:MAG TPA: RDD family protein [Thermoanaerobaculia bacterium]|nr:RDD family protein [Thermoanaerobaculia bacterium]
MTEATAVPDAPARVGYAGKNRVLAMMVDYTLMFLLALLATKVLVGGSLKGPIFVLVAFAYFFVPEWLWSATPAKAMFGLRVEQVQGGSCTLKGALSRTIFRVLEANPVFLGPIPGGIAIMRSPLKQRLGDRFGGVLVVEKRTQGKSAPPVAAV